VIEVFPDKTGLWVEKIIWNDCFFVDQEQNDKGRPRSKPKILQSSLRFLEGYLEGNLQIMCDARNSDQVLEIKVESKDILELAPSDRDDLKKDIFLDENKLIFQIETPPKPLVSRQVDSPRDGN